jgi:hypothetical protein
VGDAADDLTDLIEYRAMNLNLEPKPKAVQRALLAADLMGVVRVLATDGADIAADCENVSTDASEIGLVDGGDCLTGFWLWSGTAALEYENHEAMTPTELVYRGDVREAPPGELAGLMAMVPPQTAWDDDLGGEG